MLRKLLYRIFRLQTHAHFSLFFSLSLAGVMLLLVLHTHQQEIEELTYKLVSCFDKTNKQTAIYIMYINQDDVP